MRVLARELEAANICSRTELHLSDASDKSQINMHVVFFQLDPTAPWITENRPVTPAKLEAMRADLEQMELRRRWTAFVDSTATSFRHDGWKVDITVVDRWAISASAVDATGADIVFVPHSTRSQLGPTRRPVMFYMQVMQRWLFSADPAGWGAASSRYPCKGYMSGNPDSGVWEIYRTRLAENNQSKFMQRSAATRAELVASGAIPDRPFIFFPCQIPHDESLTLFSDISEVDLIKALADWSRKSDVTVVFKEHPANRRAMRPLRDAAGTDAFWSDASVHDLIREAAAVYTLNSGVGFETLVHETPLATFARAEYDVVAEMGEIGDLDQIWATCRGWNPTNGMLERRRFIDWYCRSHAIDLDAGADALKLRLCALVEEARGLCRASKPKPA